MRGEEAEQLVVERFLECERAVPRRERLVLELLQFRRDVALGVLERLPAAVVGRDLAGVGVGDFDVETVHVVVGDAQVRYAGAATLARFELGEEGARIGLQRAQLVQLLVVAVRDHAAVAHHGRRVFLHRAAQEREAFGRHLEIAEHPRKERRVARNRGRELGEQREAVAQGREVARARVAQRDAAGDALDVGEAAKQLVDS